MTTPVSTQPPRAVYAGATAVLAALAAGCAWVVAGVAGGDGAAQTVSAVLVGCACVVGLLPAFVASPARFGVAVLVASMARLLIVFVGALLVTEIAGHDRKPVWIGAASGAGLMLVAETALSVLILMSIERARLAREGGERAGGSPA